MKYTCLINILKCFENPTIALQNDLYINVLMRVRVDKSVIPKQ